MLCTFRLCVWFGVMSRRRDVLEESGARRRGCKGWREVCVMFSDVVLVVWLCASFALCVWRASAVRVAGPVSYLRHATLLRRAAPVGANVKGDEGCVCSF